MRLQHCRMPDDASPLIDALRNARRVVIMTGAGVSAESGIPTFRDSMEGLWKDFDPMKLATPQAFAADPEMVTRWYNWRRLGCLAADPNPGHVAIANLEKHLINRGSEFLLSTQNVDRLHHKAGSERVVELHGSIIVWRCMRTLKELTPPPVAFTEFPPTSPWWDEPKARGGIDRAILRPAVVWFGEMLPEAAVDATQRATQRCDVFISVGTSAVVYPAAGFIHEAARHGAFTAEINRDATPISDAVDCTIRAKAGEVLPGIVDAAFGK